MRNYLKPVGAALALTLSLLHVSHAHAQEFKFKPGLKEMTAEENKLLHQRKIKKVRPNKIGLERINKERQQRGQTPITTDPSLPEIDVEENKLGATEVNLTEAVLGTAPAQVDNSTLAAFPPIGHQGGLGSCVAWASTYYMMSHEVCLALGCDNKTYKTHVFSPKWTYNLINGGADNGSMFSQAFAVMEKHGAAHWTEFPYDTNYLAWDMVSDHWKRAITYRMKPSTYTNINTDAGMANVKQLLANGHVIMIGTYINSWVVRKVLANPLSASNPFVGQYIVTHLNGTSGGHAMAIVGYDDKIWTDFNNNGTVETQELGAFKIVNSYGPTWGNQGFGWAAYDAFRSTSTVPNFVVTNRVQLTQSGNASFTTYSPYTPKLLAQVNMSHALRSQIKMQFGSSANTASSASIYWSPFAFVNNGGAWAFDGTTAAKTGSFYFDISSLAAADIYTQKFYLIETDNTAGSALTTTAFNIINPSAGNTLLSAPGVPTTVDGASKTLVAGTTPPKDTIAPTVPTNLSAILRTYNYNTSAKINLSWTGSTDNVAVAKYAIYRNGTKIAETTNKYYSDTKISKGIYYTYAITAIDTSGNQSAKSNSVTKKW